MGGTRDELDLAALLMKRAWIVGSTLRARSVDEKARIVSAFLDRFDSALEAGRIRPVIDREFPLDQAGKAHRVVQESVHFGKVALRVLIRLVAIFLLALPGCMLLDSLIFFPSREMPPTPAGLEDRRFPTPDGETIHAWFAPPPDIRSPVLLWSHGNGGNVGSRADVLHALARERLGILAYDYRGYGRSTGRPSERGIYLDAEAAYDALVAEGVPAERIICFGSHSAGPCRSIWRRPAPAALSPSSRRLLPSGTSGAGTTGLWRSWPAGALIRSPGSTSSAGRSSLRTEIRMRSCPILSASASSMPRPSPRNFIVPGDFTTTTSSPLPI